MIGNDASTSASLTPNERSNGSRSSRLRASNDSGAKPQFTNRIHSSRNDGLNNNNNNFGECRNNDDLRQAQRASNADSQPFTASATPEFTIGSAQSYATNFSQNSNIKSTSSCNTIRDDTTSQAVAAAKSEERGKIYRVPAKHSEKISAIEHKNLELRGGGDSSTIAARLFPVSNGYALTTAGVVVLYSATFLLYAQRHTFVLLIMTGLIGIFIILLYALGILSFMYLMLRIQKLEKADVGVDANIACITVNNESSRALCASTIASNDYHTNNITYENDNNNNNNDNNKNSFAMRKCQSMPASAALNSNGSLVAHHYRNSQNETFVDAMPKLNRTPRSSTTTITSLTSEPFTIMEMKI